MNMHPQLRNWIIFITVVLLVVTIGLTINGRSSLSRVENLLGNMVRPVQQGLSAAADYISEKTYPIRNVFKLAEENKALKEELLVLQKDLIEQTMLQEEYNDLKLLRKSLNYAYRNNLNNFVTADVIARDAGNWYGMFVINAGKNDGITQHAMVFNEEGLIGQVFELGDDWAKVLVLIDIKGTVSFQILDENRNYDGVVNGTGIDYLKGYLFDPAADVREGDRIITSGLGVYPKGVVIGTVIKVIEDQDTLLKQVTVTPSVNYKNIDRVFVIPQTQTIEE